MILYLCTIYALQFILSSILDIVWGVGCFTLEEDKSSPAHDEADELQLIKTVEHDVSQSMKGIVEEHQRAIESEAQVKLEIEAAKDKEPKRAPIKITLPRRKSVVVAPPVPAKQPSTGDDEDTEDDDDVPLQTKRTRKKHWF